MEYLTSAIEDRAVGVLTLLADRGQHRAPSVPDLIIAATAELAGLTMLHCDKDFDLIASVTGQYGSRTSLADQGDLGVAAESGAFVEPAGAGLVPPGPRVPVLDVAWWP